MELEDRKVKLLRVGKDEVERLQGEASVWANIIDCIERDTTRVDKPLKPTV